MTSRTPIAIGVIILLAALFVVPRTGVATKSTIIYAAGGYATSTQALLLEDPAASDDFAFWRVDHDIVIKKICYLSVGGTNWVGQVQERDANGLNPIDVQDSDSTATAGSNKCIPGNESITNGTVDGGDYVGLGTSSVTGAVEELIVTIYYKTG